MSITKILPHPIYILEGWKPDVKFKCGFDIACAEVEITKSTSALSEEEVEHLYKSLTLPDLKPFDLVNNTEFKFAFKTGYPAHIYQ